ncbi:hypothetical protein, partial [uncultured Prevotella sp.]|uniref:hypothetical protein n=1 Tax=uncultured Prevotella sp. TaxID=159272 RepID=UPI0025F87D6E
MKKVLATILALVMALALCSVSWADATEVKTEAELTTAVSNGGEIKLGANITLTSMLTIPADKTVTLDLNGLSITSAGKVIKNNGILTITDTKGGGKIISTGNTAVGVGDNSKTTIKTAIIESVEGAVITGYATGATINIEDGIFSASDNAVVAGNGNRTNEAGAERTVGNTINISGGTFNGQIKTPTYVACGIYAPWKDTIKVTGGTFNITGGAGIVARAGSVSVSNATINTTGNATGKVGDSRVVVPCSAIVFDSEAAYPALTNTSAISVESGTFTSEADAISVVKPEGEGAVERVAVTGGTFSSDVSDFVDSQPVAQRNNGEYVVGTSAVVSAANTDGSITIVEGNDAQLTGVNPGVKVVVRGSAVSVNGTRVTNDDVNGYTVPSRYYYYPTTDTKTTDTKGSPKTFDAGIALYVGMALTSAAGVAFVGKK